MLLVYHSGNYMLITADCTTYIWYQRYRIYERQQKLKIEQPADTLSWMDTFRQENREILMRTDIYWMMGMDHPVHTKFHGGHATFETSKKQSIPEQTAVNDSDDGSYKGKSFTQMLTEAEASRGLYSDPENPCSAELVPKLSSDFLSGHQTQEKYEAGKNQGGLSPHQDSPQLHSIPNHPSQRYPTQDTIAQSTLSDQSISSPAQVAAATSSSTARESTSTTIAPSRRNSRARAHAATSSDETSARHELGIPVAPPVEINETQASSEDIHQNATTHHSSGHHVRSWKKSVRFSLATPVATAEPTMSTTAGTSEEVRPGSRAVVVTEEQTRRRRSTSVANRETMGTPPPAMKGWLLTLIGGVFRFCLYKRERSLHTGKEVPSTLPTDIPLQQLQANRPHEDSKPNKYRGFSPLTVNSRRGPLEFIIFNEEEWEKGLAERGGDDDNLDDEEDLEDWQRSLIDWKVERLRVGTELRGGPRYKGLGVMSHFFPTFL